MTPGIQGNQISSKQCVWIGKGDHLSGKPGIVGKMLGKLTKSQRNIGDCQGNIRGKSCEGNLVSCWIYILA